MLVFLDLEFKLLLCIVGIWFDGSKKVWLKVCGYLMLDVEDVEFFELLLIFVVLEVVVVVVVLELLWVFEVV